MTTQVSNWEKLSALNPNDRYQRAFGAKRPAKKSVVGIPISGKRSRVLKPTFPDIGLQFEYQAILRDWIEKMHASVMYWVKAAYRANEPEIAQDAVPAKDIQKAVKRLTKRWQKNFNEAAPELAVWFSTKANKRSDKRLKKILKDAGWSIDFKMTAAQRDVLHATINQNVSLIKSIPQKYLNDVEGLVMRSVQTGRDLNSLTKALQKQYKVTYKRAALIARDQSNKATSALNRARQMELGITEAIWLHSHAGKTFRPTHVAMHGKTFNIKKGMYDKAVKAWIHPGELINCRCVQRPVIPGFS